MEGAMDADSYGGNVLTNRIFSNAEYDPDGDTTSYGLLLRRRAVWRIIVSVDNDVVEHLGLPWATSVLAVNFRNQFMYVSANRHFLKRGGVGMTSCVAPVETVLKFSLLGFRQNTDVLKHA